MRRRRWWEWAWRRMRRRRQRRRKCFSSYWNIWITFFFEFFLIQSHPSSLHNKTFLFFFLHRLPLLIFFLHL
jgi:hypothetical protein